MKNMKKRVLSFLIVLMMVLSLLPASVFAAQVNYDTTATVLNEKGSASGYTDVVKNWGKRGELATFLSPMAEDFYGNLTYSKLSGYTEDQLQTLMAGDYPIPDYDDGKFLLAYTDCERNGYYISDFYTGEDILPVWDGGLTWNREHTWPQSKSLGGNDNSVEEDDMVMIRPVSSSINSSRGNSAFGESEGYYDPNKNTTTYDVRGDVARMMLYGYIRWDMTNAMWGKEGVIESQEVLLSWMAADPVDTWEMGRNDAIQSISGTRNVFVDYPELAFIVLDEAVPTMNTPSGNAKTVSYTVTASSNNEAYGKVHVNDDTVTAMPAAGYEAVGYTLLSGSATVKRNGNVFTVSGACSIRINFAAVESATVNYIQDDVVISSAAVAPGTVVFLPEYSGSVPEDYQFVGWVDQEVTPSATGPQNIYAPGAAYTVKTGINKIYALYTYVDMSVGGEQYSLVTNASQLSVGSKIVVVYAAGAKAMSAASSNGNNRTTTPVTINDDDTITWVGDAVQILTLEQGTLTGTYKLQAGTDQYLYAASSTANQLRTGRASTVGDNGSWKITVSGGVATVKAQGSNSRNWIRYNSQSNIISCYGSGQSDICLYRAVASGTTMYTTSAGGCDHAVLTDVAAVAPTCDAVGYTASKQCVACKAYVEGREEVPALGHSYTSKVTPPSYDWFGYTTYTCIRCGDSYKADYTEPLKNIHKVSFAVPEGIEAVETMDCGSSGITLPEAEAPEGYTFAGWTAAQVEETTTVPSFNKAGANFKTDADTTLYALYSYNVGGSGSADYELTDLEDISADVSVVVTMTYGDTVYALTSANDASAAPTAVIITLSGNKLAAEPAEALQWNIAADSGSYIFYPAGTTSKWLYCTNTNNGVRVGTGANKAFTLDADTGYLNNTGTSRFLGVYRTNPDWRCYTSTTTNIKDQTLRFYAKQSGGTTYYTTLEGVQQKPAGVAVYSGTEQLATYSSLEEALAYYDVSSEYIKLLGDTQVNVTLDDSIYLDMNGYTLTGTMVTDGYSVYGMDSATDEYTCTNLGVFACVDQDGAAVAPERMIQVSSTMTGSAKRYLTIETEDGYTFHRFYLGITHYTVKPTARGVGYKAVFAGDDMVKEKIDSFGYTLQLEGNDAVNCSKTGADFVSQKKLTLRVDNYDADKFGTTGLSASVYMVLDGQTITATQISFTLKGLVEQINNTNLTAEQKDALSAWIADSKTMQTWDVDNIYSAS